MDNNYNNPKKDIDLSNAFDSTIEKKKESAYVDQSIQKRKKNKKGIYLAIIIISWIVILGVVFSTMAKNTKQKKQAEKIRQDMQLRMQQLRTQQNENIQNKTNE